MSKRRYTKVQQLLPVIDQMLEAGMNAMAENFFAILKIECIYRHKPRTFQEANDLIDRYLLL